MILFLTWKICSDYADPLNKIDVARVMGLKQGTTVIKSTDSALYLPCMNPSTGLLAQALREGLNMPIPDQNIAMRLRRCNKILLALYSKTINQLQQPASQACQHHRARCKNLEPREDGIVQCLIQAMEDSDSHISPRCELRVLIRVAQHGQCKTDRIEDGWLLMQVVVVLRDLIDRLGNLRSDVVVEVLCFQTDIVVANGSDARRVHPSLHDECPSSQCGHWLKQRSAGDCERHCVCAICRVVRLLR